MLPSQKDNSATVTLMWLQNVSYKHHKSVIMKHIVVLQYHKKKTKKKISSGLSADLCLPDEEKKKNLSMLKTATEQIKGHITMKTVVTLTSEGTTHDQMFEMSAWASRR